MLSLKQKKNTRWFLRFPDNSKIYVRTRALAANLCAAVREEGVDCRLFEEYDLFIKGQDEMRHADHKEFDRTRLAEPAFLVRPCGQ